MRRPSAALQRDRKINVCLFPVSGISREIPNAITPQRPPVHCLSCRDAGIPHPLDGLRMDDSSGKFCLANFQLSIPRDEDCWRLSAKTGYRRRSASCLNSQRYARPNAGAEFKSAGLNARCGLGTIRAPAIRRLTMALSQTVTRPQRARASGKGRRSQRDDGN